jgi:hypothetical protein
MISTIKSTIKYLYNLYKKLQTGCNSTEVLNSVEKQTDEIIVSVTSEVKEDIDTTTERTRANTIYQETHATINENIEKIVSEGADKVIESIQMEPKPIITPTIVPQSEPIYDQQSEYSSIHSPPPSPESGYNETQTEIIGVVDMAGSSIINSSEN